MRDIYSVAGDSQVLKLTDGKTRFVSVREMVYDVND